MPLALALIASLALHISALVSGPFGLPEALEQEIAAEDTEALVLHARLNALHVPRVRAQDTPVKPDKPQKKLPSSKSVPANDEKEPAPATPVVEPPQQVEPTAAAATTDVHAEPTPDPDLTSPLIDSPPPLLEHAQLSYVVTRGDRGFVIGRSTLAWSRNNLDYTATSVIETTGLAALFKDVRVTQESRGRVDARGLHPEQFRYAQIKRTDEAQIDRATNRVVNNGRVVPLQNWGPTVQDLLSMYYQLGLLLKTEPQADGFEMPIVTGRKLAVYRFEIVGNALIETPAGSLDARHLKALNGDDVIELWYAPEHYDVPVRLRFTDRNKDVFEQNLESPMKGTPR